MDKLPIPFIDVHQKDGVLVTTSRCVASVFEKEHKNVLADIRAVIEANPDKDFSRLNFQPSEFATERGKIYPEYLLTRDGTMLLVMGYTGPKAMMLKTAYIKRFNEMEAIVKGIAESARDNKKLDLNARLEVTSKILRDAGLEKNHLAIAMDRAVYRETGFSALAWTGVELQTKDNEVVYTPTELGKMMVPPVSGREVNLRLIEAGLQVATGSKHGPYQPTQRGKDEGATLVDVAITGKAEPITHLKWPKAVIKLIDFDPVLDV